MRMEDEHNYQPVMIRTLNQNHGEATKDAIIEQLHKYNPTYPKNHFNDCPVFDVLQKHNVVRFSQSKNKYELLDYDDIDSFYGRKAEITKLCDDKIENEKKYIVLEKENEIENAQNIFLNNLRNFTTKKDKIVIGFPGPEEKVTDDVEYISSVNLWWYSKKLDDATTPRYWNCFGLGEPIWGKNNNIVVEINPPISGVTRRVFGAFVKDQSGTIYLTHNGVLGGGNTPGGFYDVYPHEERWILADDGKKEPRELILISDVSSPELPELLADYVKIVSKYKSGELVSNITPYYLLLRHKSEDNPYQDDPSGKVYHFHKIPNYTKVVPGAKAIWFDRKDGDYYFWGYGTVLNVNQRSDNDSDAIFKDFTFFDEEPESLESFGKFLKKASTSIQDKILNYLGWNIQSSILEINKEIYDEIVGGKETKLDDPFEIGHKLFLIEMSQKEHKLTKKDIVIVNAHNWNKIDPYIDLLDQFGIPSVALADKQYSGAKSNVIKLKNDLEYELENLGWQREHNEKIKPEEAYSITMNLLPNCDKKKLMDSDLWKVIEKAEEYGSRKFK